MMEILETIQGPVQKVSGTFGILANSFLIYLIIFHSPKSLGAYKYLMMYISLFEILYSLLDVSISPILFTTDSGLLAILDSSKSGIPLPILLILNILFCGSFGLSMAIFGTHFVFRYLIIKGNKTMTASNPLTVLVWLLIPVGLGTIWSLICMIFLFPTPEKNKFLEETYLKRFPGKIEDLTYFGPYFYPKENKLDWNPCIGIALCSLLMLISSSTMAYCGIKCYYRINCLVRTTTQSNHHKNLHSQFLKALIVETLVPVFLMHFPAAIAYLSCFLNMSSEVYGNILTMSIALFPAVDPLPTMIIVSSYRNAILKFVANPFKNFDFIQKLVEAIKIHVDADDTEMDVL